MEMTVTTPSVPVGGMQGENYVYHDTRLLGGSARFRPPLTRGNALFGVYSYM
jgi:hypothetical protein